MKIREWKVLILFVMFSIFGQWNLFGLLIQGLERLMFCVLQSGNTKLQKKKKKMRRIEAWIRRIEVGIYASLFCNFS